MKFLISFFIFFFALTNAFAEQTAYPFTSSVDAKRFETLTKQIRCVVCQNQSIADSNAPIANDLRDKIYKMILDHHSNADIKEYLASRYGEFILLQPRMSQLTFLLWAFPMLALSAILFIFFRIYRTNRG